MIRVTRGRAREPHAQQQVLDLLTHGRQTLLADVARKQEASRLRAKDYENAATRDVFPTAKSALHDDQYGKCCYCERYASREHDHLEHFRPKTLADRRPGHPVGAGYYWLAWDWNNLLFACGDCNFAKNTRFPLASGCQPLQPGQALPGSESPLLIDPGAGIDPFACIQFRPVIDPGGETRWRPFPRRGSLLGVWTIRELKLDKPGLLERYRKHISLTVNQAVESIRQALERVRDADTPELLQAEWNRRLDWLCDPEQELIALSCDVLDHHFPRMFRRRWDLAEPRPDFAL